MQKYLYVEKLKKQSNKETNQVTLKKKNNPFDKKMNVNYVRTLMIL